MRYKGCELRPSRTADREMVDCHLYLDDVLRVLEDGWENPRSPRRAGVVERTKRIRGRRVKVVAVESLTRWNGEKVWLIVHVGYTGER